MHGRLLDVSVPRIMGILNVTPDSFYDGGRFDKADPALRQAEKMLSEGADIIDVGGYSTRPGAAEISQDEELQRVTQVIAAIKKRFPECVISVDTFRSRVAAAAIAEGAGMINDVSGGDLDREMFATVARLKVPYVLMHMRGTPGTMAQLTDYTDLVKEVISYLHRKIHELKRLGVTDIIVDPGFGFAKTREQNFTLLNQLDDLAILGCPVLVGLSRKSMVWKTLGIAADEALNGSTVLNTVALLKGADLLRVHDVKPCLEVVRLVTALRKSASSGGSQ